MTLSAGTAFAEDGDNLPTKFKTNEYRIGFLAEKEGSYSVKYDVVDFDGNVISKHSMKVCAYESPVTS